MFGIGVQELAVIFILALLIFGPKRLPELARTIGKGLAEFRKASGDLRQTFDLGGDLAGHRPPPPPVNADPRTIRDPGTLPDQVGDPTVDEPAPEQPALPLGDAEASAAADAEGHGDLAALDDARDRARAALRLAMGEEETGAEPEEKDRG